MVISRGCATEELDRTVCGKRQAYQQHMYTSRDSDTQGNPYPFLTNIFIQIISQCNAFTLHLKN